MMITMMSLAVVAIAIAEAVHVNNEVNLGNK